MTEIRYVEENDKRAWYTFDNHLPKAEFMNKVNLRQGYIIEVDGVPAGILRYNLFWDSIPFCTLIYIGDEYRGMDLGRQLLTHWEQDMKELGYGMLLTSTQVDEDAQHFYRKMGYKDCGGLCIDIPMYAQPMELFLSKAL